MTDVVDLIRDRISPDDPWTGIRTIEEDARKQGIDDPREKVNKLDGIDLVTWHGLITIAEEQYVKTALGEEFAGDFTRSHLVEKLESTIQSTDPA